jgi:hypothetical protein
MWTNRFHAALRRINEALDNGRQPAREDTRNAKRYAGLVDRATGVTPAPTGALLGDGAPWPAEHPGTAAI